MTNLNDVLLAMSNIPVDDPIAEIWGRGLQGGGYTIIEYTGALPITINASGEPLIDYQIYGNTVQNDTPTPENPIMPIGCGERTENLFDISTVEKGRIDGGEVGYSSQTSSLTIEGGNVYFTTTSIYRGVCSGFFEIPNGTKIITFNFITNDAIAVKFVFYDTDKTWLNLDYTPDLSTIPPATANIPSGAKYVRFSFTGQISSGYSYTMSNLMLNTGSTHLPYEPYGYKLPILSNSTVTNIYLGEVETTRRISKIDLGTLNWGKTASGNFLSGTTIPNIKIISNVSAGNAICDIFKEVMPNNVANTPYSFSSCLNFIGRPFINKTGFEDLTVADFKQAMSGVYMYYVLAEPETAVVNEPLMKIGDYADTVNMEQAGVSIPTNKGSTVIDYDGALKPSQMYIKYLGVKK